MDPEHEELFQNKIFLSFRRAKNLKDTLVRAKLPNSDDGGLSVRAVTNAMAGKVVRFVV